MIKTPLYNTMTFADVWDEEATFLSDYQSNGIPTTITEDSIKTLFYLLYARYGNNPIANMDINQFKYKMFSVIFQYGPTWERRLQIQNSLRSMSEAELLSGAKTISNHAYNPSAEPTTGSTEEIDYINEQNTLSAKKGNVEAYAMLWSMLKTDVTENFLKQFQKCFKLVVRPENPLLYIEEESED